MMLVNDRMSHAAGNQPADASLCAERCDASPRGGLGASLRLLVKVLCLNLISVQRLLALIGLALSLALASGPAFAVPSKDCPMAASQAMAGGHDEMGCCELSCAPECAAVCPSAVEPTIIGTRAPADLPGQQLLACPPDALLAINPGSADPPPRTTLS